MVLRKVAVLLSVFLIAGLVYGCGSASSSSSSNPNMSEAPATAPTGVSDVSILGGSISVSGTTLNFDMSAVDQNSDPITNITRGNLTVGIYDTASATGVRAASIVATATITNLTSGSNTSQPVAVAMTLDKSGSMNVGGKRVSLEAAAINFVELMSTDSQAAVINFDNLVTIEASMTSDKNVLRYAVTQEAPGTGGTNILDSVDLAIGEAANVNSANYTRAVLAMTDGVNGTSVATEAQITAEAIAQGIPIYTVGVFANTVDAAAYRPMLVRLAETTVGTSDAYKEIVVGVTGLSAQSVVALGALDDIYTEILNTLTAATYNTTCTLSSAVPAGTYYMKVTLHDYGFDREIIKPIVVN